MTKPRLSDERLLELEEELLANAHRMGEIACELGRAYPYGTGLYGAAVKAHRAVSRLATDIEDQRAMQRMRPNAASGSPGLLWDDLLEVWGEQPEAWGQDKPGK